MSDDGSATIAKWQRKMDRAEEGDRKAKTGMKEAIKEAMEDVDTHRNIARELTEARQGGRKAHTQMDKDSYSEGYGNDGEIITGYGDDRPWDRE